MTRLKTTELAAWRAKRNKRIVQPTFALKARLGGGVTV